MAVTNVSFTIDLSGLDLHTNQDVEDMRLALLRAANAVYGVDTDAADYKNIDSIEVSVDVDYVIGDYDNQSKE